MKPTCKWQDQKCQNDLWIEKRFDYQSQSLVPIKFSMIRFIITECLDIKKPISVLDIGGGDGGLYRQLKDLEISKYVYCDIAPEAARRFQETLPNIPPFLDIRICDINKEKFENRFSIICIAGFVINMYEPELLLSMYKDNIEKNGLLIIECTNFDFNNNELDKLFPELTYRVDYNIYQKELANEKHIPFRTIRAMKG